MLNGAKLLRFAYFSSFLLFAVINTLYGTELEYEQDIFGESSDSSDYEMDTDDSLPDNLGIVASVQNTFDHLVHVYYQDNPPILIVRFHYHKLASSQITCGDCTAGYD
jgi:hypothetical protein